MYTPQATSQFKKDLKRQVGNLERFLRVAVVMNRVVSGERLAPELKSHKLSGQYDDCWECHVFPDLLLVWIPDTKARVVTFVRLGSPSELFG